VFQERSLDAFLRLVLEEAIRRLRADRGSIFLHEREENHLFGFAMTGLELSPPLRLEGGKGIVGEVVRTGETLVIDDAYEDERFYKDVDLLTGYRTRAIICAAIVSEGHDDSERRIWGALELLNPVGRDTFDSLDVESLGHILGFAGLRLQENAKVERLLRHAARMESELALAKGRASEEEVLQRLVGKSDSLERLRGLLVSVAPFDSNVLIQGESGTGKELVAQCLHALSPRRSNPFVALNCAAIPETLMEAELFGIESGVATGVTRRVGKIEQAQGGTLFLDEIGEMSPATQAKLLRALQEREITRVGGKDSVRVDVRFVSATHRDLMEMIAHRQFREDLYYRLHVVNVTLPPLRDRRGDVALLASHFLAELNDKYTRGYEKAFAPGVLPSLETLVWPGNVRELQNAVERAFVVSGGEPGRLVTRAHFGLQVEGGVGAGAGTGAGPGAAQSAGQRMASTGSDTHADTHADTNPDAQGAAERHGVSTEHGVYRGGTLNLSCAGMPLMAVVDAAERLLVKAALEEHKGNKTKAAEALGISREGLRKMLTRWGEDA
jgi:transcriptional regulator with PAS, ATPase and Fis domain